MTLDTEKKKLTATKQDKKGKEENLVNADLYIGLVIAVGVITMLWFFISDLSSYLKDKEFTTPHIDEMYLAMNELTTLELGQSQKDVEAKLRPTESEELEKERTSKGDKITYEYYVQQKKKVPYTASKKYDFNIKGSQTVTVTYMDDKLSKVTKKGLYSYYVTVYRDKTKQ